MLEDLYRRNSVHNLQTAGVVKVSCVDLEFYFQYAHALTIIIILLLLSLESFKVSITESVYTIGDCLAIVLYTK